MKITTFSGESASIFGKDWQEYKREDGSQLLSGPVPYTAEFEELEEGDEIPAKEAPDKDDLRKWANNRRKAAARQRETEKAGLAAGCVKPTLADESVAFKNIYKTLMASGKHTHETATVKAKEALGID
jgi:hypothetical protein